MPGRTARGPRSNSIRIDDTRLADVLGRYPDATLVAVGHTDSTGSEMHNQELSERRAQAVRIGGTQYVDPARQLLDPIAVEVEFGMFATTM